MNKNTLALSIALCFSLGLSGCDDAPNPAQADVIVNSQVTAQVNKDQQELKKYLADMQKTDPSIKDMYYGYDAQGHKTLHIIKDDRANIASATSIALAPSITLAAPAVASSTIQSNNLVASPLAQPHYTDYAWSMVEGALIYHMFMGGGGFNSVTSHYVPTSHVSNISTDDYRKRKNTTTYAYNSYLSSTYRNRYYTNYSRNSSSGSYSSNSSEESSTNTGSRSGSTSRSSGVFSSTSSARGGGYSSGS